jgi:two-component system response regulator
MNAEGNILLVEDNPADEALTMRALKNSKITQEVSVARDGAEALDYLHGTGIHAGRDPRHLPSVVLLDLQLPKLDGLQVLRRMRANLTMRLLPVIILTSSREQQDLVSGYGLGAHSYIRKPVDLDQFVSALHQLGLLRLVGNATPG